MLIWASCVRDDENDLSYEVWAHGSIACRAGQWELAYGHGQLQGRKCRVAGCCYGCKSGVYVTRVSGQWRWECRSRIGGPAINVLRGKEIKQELEIRSNQVEERDQWKAGAGELKEKFKKNRKWE